MALSPTCERCGATLDAARECPRCTVRVDPPDALAEDTLLARVPRTQGGIVLGGVRLVRALGAGGMGAVYAGRQLELDREVAVKILKTADREAAERFRREGQIAARLEHPNLVRVLHAGNEHGLAFLVLELVRGTSARGLIAHGPLPEARAVSIAFDAARGLARAHGAGILHRDVKPENILVDAASGSAKLADLGLARPIEESREHGITQEGCLVGTPAYLAPELWSGGASSFRGRRLGARSDPPGARLGASRVRRPGPRSSHAKDHGGEARDARRRLGRSPRPRRAVPREGPRAALPVRGRARARARSARGRQPPHLAAHATGQ